MGRLEDLWAEHWDANVCKAHERSGSQWATEDFRPSGRKSKDWPNKEDDKWWAAKGPEFIEKWVNWRKTCGMKIAEFPGAEGEAVPGIELEVWAKGYSDITYRSVKNEAPDLQVRSIIDRVFEDSEGDYRIVDLKSGTFTEAWPRQMALNNLGLVSMYGENYRARWAGYWKAREGGVPFWYDLSVYDDDDLWDMVAKAKQIRDQGLFLPVPNNLCKEACGVRQFCWAMGGDPSLIDTMQQRHKE